MGVATAHVMYEIISTMSPIRGAKRDRTRPLAGYAREK